MLRSVSLLKVEAWCTWLLSVTVWDIFLFFVSLASWEWSLIRDHFVKQIFVCVNPAVLDWWEPLMCADSCLNWCEHWISMFSSLELSIRRTYAFENYTEKQVIQISFFMQILIQSKKKNVYLTHVHSQIYEFSVDHLKWISEANSFRNFNTNKWRVWHPCLQLSPLNTLPLSFPFLSSRCMLYAGWSER